MTFFRSFPPEGTDLDLEWPLDRYVYTTMFWGPFGGGASVGFALGGYAGIAISLPVGGVIGLLEQVTRSDVEGLGQLPDDHLLS